MHPCQAALEPLPMSQAAFFGPESIEEKAAVFDPLRAVGAVVVRPPSRTVLLPCNANQYGG